MIRKANYVGFMAGSAWQSLWFCLPNCQPSNLLCRGSSQELLQVKIQRLIIDPSSNQPVVFLTDLQEERALLIWIGPCEANAMNAEMEGTRHPRPQTHDLWRASSGR